MTRVDPDDDVPYGTHLQLYLETLLKWQVSINLISSASREETWNRHFQDSLQIIPLIPDACRSIIDLGSGAGFPGLVVAIATRIPVRLIESDRKKCLFLKEVVRKTGAPATVLNTRIEAYKGPLADLILSRGLAALTDLLAYSEPLLAPGGQMIFLKGQKLQNEIAEAQKKWHFKYEINSSLTSSAGQLVRIWGLHDGSICNR